MYQSIPQQKILVEDRQRKTFNEMEIFELSESILENGLIHAPVVTPADSEGNHKLIVGERRLRALRGLQKDAKPFSYMGTTFTDTIPCAILDEADPIKLKQIELEENIRRTDLTWQEKAEATQALHELRKQQTQGQQTFSDTARETDLSPQTVAVDLQLAAALDDPEISKAKTQREALKLLKLKAERQANEDRAKAFNLEAAASLPHKLIQGEAIEILDKMPDSFVDVILTDPPYGVGADTFGNQTAISHHYDDSFESWQTLMQAFAEQALRVTKAESHAYVFCDIRHWKPLAEIFSGVGFDVWSRPFIWYKGNIGTLPRPEHGPRFCYEAILYAIKGNRKVQKAGAHDVLSIPTTPKGRHAAEKPVELYCDLLSRSARPGDVVLDPFCGTGTIFPAGNRLQLRSVGVEIDPASFGIASSRLEEVD